MRLFIISSLLILAPLFSRSQSNFESLDAAASTIKAKSVEDLHNRLTKGLNTDIEKLRAFYSWLAQNIRYDVNEANRSFRSVNKQEPERVLTSKLAVCHGYASLFKELCDRSKIKCYLVSGFTRIDDKFDEAGHTWNLVFVNNKWQQIDVTWAAGGVNSQNKFVKKYSDKYFLPISSDFLTEHFPFDPMWQLSEHPVTLKNYKLKNTNRTNENSKVFSYTDTITNWEQQDSLQRMLSSAMRMNKFNPGNKIIEQELAFAFLENGNGEFEKGSVILKELYPNKSTNHNSKQKTAHENKIIIAKLDSIERYYLKATYFYDQVKFTSAFEKQVLQNNKKAVKNNLEIIRKEKQMLSK